MRFPRNPSFNDILLMLEEKRKEKQRLVGGRKLLEDTFQERMLKSKAGINPCGCLCVVVDEKHLKVKIFVILNCN